MQELIEPSESVRVLKRALIDGRATEGIEIRPGQTVAEAVEARTPNLMVSERSILRVVLYERDTSHVIDAQHWSRVRLKPGAFLVITDPPMGGGLRQILTLVIAVAALVVAGPLAGPLGVFGASLVAAGLSFAGNQPLALLISNRSDLQ